MSSRDLDLSPTRQNKTGSCGRQEMKKRLALGESGMIAAGGGRARRVRGWLRSLPAGWVILDKTFRGPPFSYRQSGGDTPRLAVKI